MLRYWCLVILLAVVAPDAMAQSRQQRRSSVKKTTKAPPAPKVTVDTFVAKPVEVPPPVVAIDSPKTDSSKLEKVADVVHDSVKAQLKAPIVQVPVTLKRLIIPGVLFAYGAVTLNNGGLRVFNQTAQDWVWNGQQYASPYMEDYMLLVPAVAVYGLNIAGVKGQNNLIDRSIIYGMSNLIANGIGFGVKYFGIEERPDKTDHSSFPSGHTAEAFVSAEFLHQEYKQRLHWSIIASGYAVATSVAFLRMYHNKHWLSDVVAGAGIGMASTRFSYYLYPIFKHVLFGSKKVKQTTMILPTYKAGGVYGISMVYGF
jgi:membrane-associated phospholipid phosphatase